MGRGDRIPAIHRRWPLLSAPRRRSDKRAGCIRAICPGSL